MSGDQPLAGDPGDPGDPGGSIRILHVDDDTALANLTATFLTRASDRFEVETAGDVADALERFDPAAFDCVVSDFDMPGGSGIDLLRAVREVDEEIPFILFTGKGSEEVASDAISAGVTDYLQKGTGTGQYDLLANRIVNTVEQTRANRAVERTRRRFRTLVEEATDVILVVGPDGTISYATPSAEHVLGRAPEALIGTNGFDLVHPADREHVTTEFGNLLASEDRRRRVEFRYQRPDGSVIWIEARGRDLLSDDEIGGVVVYGRDVTPRKERELDLERTNALLSTLFDTLPVGVLAEDGSREVLAANRHLADLFDVSGGPDEVEGTDCGRLSETLADQFADPDGFLDRIEDLLAAPEPVREETLALADGRTVARSHESIPLSDGEGHLWVYRDVTDRTERRRRLRQQAAFLQNSPDAFFVLDEEGTVTYQSHASEAVLGTSRRDLEGESPISYIHPEDRETALADFEYLLAHPSEPVTTEYRSETPTGEWRWYENRALNRLDDPTIDGILVVKRDITERKDRERKIRALQRRIEELVRASTREEIAEVAVATAAETLGLPLSGVHLVDDERTRLAPIAVTDGVREHLGGAPTYDRTDPDRPTDAVNWELFERGETVVIEDTRENGWVPASATPSRSGIVHPLGDHGLFITSSPEPHAFDETDVALTEILATVVTAALDRTERETVLRDRTRSLESETERLEEFASVVSHDLRNPLTVAQGRLDLALEECDSDHLEPVGRALERMRVLIDDLLALARCGGSPGERTTVHVGTLAERCWATVPTDGARLVADADATIRADESRLQQLFENLFRNSVEHGSTSPRSGPPEDSVEHGSTGSRTESADSVEHGSTGSRSLADDSVEHGSTIPRSTAHGGGEAPGPAASERESPGTPVVTVRVGDLTDGFYVEDDGPGIPPGDRDRVFDIGYSTSRDGTGFGLRIAQQVAEEHGWTIRATEGTDGGARFEITGVAFDRR